jgi:hypothetical protein
MKSIQEELQRVAKQFPGDISQKAQGDIDYDNSTWVDEYLQKEFSGVVPTSKDFFKGKIHAYKIAAERLKKEHEEKAAVKRRELFTRMWTVEEMAEMALLNGKAIGLSEGFDFVVDNNNKHVFDLLCLYFTNNKQFEDYGIGDKKYSLDKGIWLQSPLRGTGKSVMLRSFYINRRSCYGYKHTTELAVLFQKKGFEAIDHLIGLLPQPPSPLNFYQNEIGFMYDELFGEEKVNHMGSPLSISGYIINKLYDFSNSVKNKKWKFHCTSNTDGADIETIAGKNYRSRMADMFNLIKLEGEDRRK